MPKIPGIQRNEPQSAPSIGRNEVQAPSAEPQLKVLNSFTKLADTATDAVIEYEKNAQDVAVKDLTNKYKAALYGTGLPSEEKQTVNKFLQTPKEGQDFTKNYADYLGYQSELKDQFLALPNVSESVSNRLKAEMAEIDFYADRSVNVEYYKANNIRTTKVYEADIDSKLRIDIPNAVAVYNDKDPETTTELQNTLLKIGESAKDYNIKLGFKEDDPVLKSKISDTVGSAANLAVNDALNVKDTKKAQSIWERYQSIIPKKEAEVTKKKIADVIIDKEIDDYVNKYLGMREDMGVAEIQKSAPAELREEIEKRYVAKKTQLNEQKNRISNQVENSLKNLIMAEASNGNPYLTVEQFEKDPRVSSSLRLLNANDRQSLRNAIGVRPKAGDPTKYEFLMDKYRSGELQSWSLEELNKEGTTLNGSQWNRILRYWGNDKAGANVSTRRRVLKDIKDAVTPHLSRDQFGNLNAEGRYQWSEFIEPYLMNSMDLFPKDYTNYNDYNNDVKKLKIDVINRIKKDGRSGIPEQFPLVPTPKAERKKTAPPIAPGGNTVAPTTTGGVKEKLKQQYSR